MKNRSNRTVRPERIKRTVRCTLSFCLAAMLAISIPAAALADTAGEDTVRVASYDTDTEITATEPAITDGVYQITSAGELYWFAEEVNSGNTSIDAVLCNDITVNEDVLNSAGTNTNDGDYIDWTPIGTSSAPYLGTFDGAGYTVYGIYYYLISKSYLGFFGALGAGASVLDLTVSDSYLLGQNYVGGIAGYAAGASIQGCVNESRIYGAGYCAGGITGCTDDAASITDCENYGAVYGSKRLAGICGDNNDGSVISWCINGGSISAEMEDTAGICGNNDSTSTVTYCFNYGSVQYSESSTVYAVCESNDGGKVKNNYYVASSDSRSTYSDIYALEVPSEDASGGYLCYQLNGQSSEAADLHFYQTLGTDTYPVLDSSHGIVYRVSIGVYSNTAPSTTTTSSSSSSDSDSSGASSAAPNGTKITKGKITYVVSSQSAQTVTVKSVKKTAKKVTIPATISYNGVTYSVTKISANACKNCKKLKKVTIGANVTVIGKKAFYNCSKLKTVIFTGRRIQSIRKKAFKGTAKKITVKASGTRIKSYRSLLKSAGISSKAKYVKT